MVKGMQNLFDSLSTYVAIFLTVLAQVNGNPDNLITYLFNKSRYDKRIMPSEGEHGQLNITIGLTVIKFDDLKERNQQLVTHAILHQTWRDPLLVWNPSDFNGTKIIAVKPDKIWFPDVALFNSAGAEFSKGLLSSDALLSFNGKLEYNIRDIFHTVCKVNVDSYPIDKQECKLVFGSWGHHGGKIILNSEDEMIDLSSYVINGEWDLQKTSSIKQNVKCYGEENYPHYDITFSITIRRKVLYFAMYLIIPGTLIALMASTVFLLPLDCSERVTAGMAVLVALSFFFLLVSEKMPASSKVPIIGGYYTATMVEMAISFFLNVVILRFHHMTYEPVPSWVKKYILHYGARFLRIKFHDKVNQSHEAIKLQPPATEEMGHMVKRNLAENNNISIDLYVADKVITTIVQKRTKIAARDAEWKKAAEILNYYALIFHIIAVIITFVGVFCEEFI